MPQEQAQSVKEPMYMQNKNKLDYSQGEKQIMGVYSNG